MEITNVQVPIEQELIQKKKKNVLIEKERIFPSTTPIIRGITNEINDDKYIFRINIVSCPGLSFS